MEQTGRRSKRKVKTIPIIRSLSDALLLEDPIGALWPTLVSTVFQEAQNPVLENLSRECQALYLVDLLDREVKNGGFDQFFSNISGRYCDETEWALTEVGAETLLNLLRRARSVFPNGLVPKNDIERRAALQELPGETLKMLGVLDEEFNSLIDSARRPINEPENPWFLALQYMKKHETVMVASDESLN
jgi:hypothetical protein